MSAGGARLPTEGQLRRPHSRVVEVMTLTEAELDRIQEAAWALHPAPRAEFEQQAIKECST